MKYVLALTATLALFSHQSLAVGSVISSRPSSTASITSKPGSVVALPRVPSSMTQIRASSATSNRALNPVAALRPLTKSPLQLRLLQAKQAIARNGGQTGAIAGGLISAGALATAVGMAADAKHDVQQLKDQVEAQKEQNAETTTTESGENSTEADEGEAELTTEGNEADEANTEEYNEDSAVEDPETSEDNEEFTEDSE
ncbi:hypothetical protein MP638_004137 [Amoeboaphelidium occidentale]|nr:hypothetical protein MP638_004137 [Amoeboaphelidium occidentale]